jgi:hypothetical protein
MLLASRLKNRIPDDPAWIAKRIGSTIPVDTQLLVASGFLEAEQDASTTLARGLHVAPRGEERRGEDIKTKTPGATAPGGESAGGGETSSWDMAPPAPEKPAVKKSANGTWLTPFLAVFTERRGAVTVSRLGKVVAPIRAAVGDESALRAFDAWTISGDARFGLEWFAANFRAFLPQKIKLLENGDPTPETVALLERAFGK